MMQQAILLSKKPHIVIATPGRIVDHIEATKGFNLSNVKFLVLDEADRLLSMDFEKEINAILEAVPRKRQTFLFSATMTGKVDKLQRASLTDPVKIEVSDKYSTVDTLRQTYLFIPHKYKDCYLAYLMQEFAGNSTIIFTSTCNGTQRLCIFLRTLGFPAIPIHGNLPQPKRMAALEKFKTGVRNILIATDVASRGLDIPNVDIVLNYDVPSTSKDYIHRVGRTARAGRSGKAITFVTQYDVEVYQRIEEMIQKKLDAFPAQEERVLSLLEKVTEARRVAALELKEFEQSHRDSKRPAESSDDAHGSASEGEGIDDRPTQNSSKISRSKAHHKRQNKKSTRT